MNEIEIYEAISYMKEMRSICDTDSGVVPQSYDMALSALREKAEREKGCEFCKDEKRMPTGGIDSGFYLAGEALTYCHQVAADDFFEDDTFVHYCPMCGKRLEVEP